MSGTEGPGCVSRETAVERRATTRRAAAVVALGIDDKIELNGRMCRTLEGIARAIFQAWFVDFAPVRAKAAGAKRFRGMPQAVFDTLPTQFVNSPLRPIPRGWAVQVLDEIADFLNGLALQKFPPHDGRSLPVIKIAQLRAGHIAGADQAGVDIDPAYVVGDGDVLFSWSGSLECILWAGGPWVVAFRNDVSTSGAATPFERGLSTETWTIRAVRSRSPGQAALASNFGLCWLPPQPGRHALHIIAEC